MFDHINQNVRRFTKIPDADIEAFNALLKVKEVPKKTLLLKEGEVCTFQGYVNKGCLRTYYIDENGTEVTLSFPFEDWWIGDLASFNSCTPSKIYIETLEDCELFMLTPDDVNELYEKHPVFERVYRLLITRSLISLYERFYFTISKPALERYKDFMEKYPALPLRVSQQHIASYLGISPEFLSKLRGKMAKGEV